MSDKEAFISIPVGRVGVGPPGAGGVGGVGVAGVGAGGGVVAVTLVFPVNDFVRATFASFAHPFTS
ncbi:hypothetical protein IJM86_05415 [bacterium]|nr:hypothetical protein [bacterium]